MNPEYPGTNPEMPGNSPENPGMNPEQPGKFRRLPNHSSQVYPKRPVHRLFAPKLCLSGRHLLRCAMAQDDLFSPPAEPSAPSAVPKISSQAPLAARMRPRNL